MQNITREMRGIPLWLLREYLEEMGGTAINDNLVQADDWKVTLTKLEPFKLGSLEVGQVLLGIEVEENQADDFFKRFNLKTLRAGG
jgi:Domain of unknown function (DUF1952)